MLKEPPIFNSKFENVLEYESGGTYGVDSWKNQRPKISCYCTFKKQINLSLCFFFTDLQVPK